MFARATEAITDAGLIITESVHSLARNGQRWFNLNRVEVDNIIGGEGMEFLVAVRNSYDKSAPAGLVAGTTIMICENMDFNGEVKVGRRHTTELFRDINGQLSAGINAIMAGWQDQANRLNGYKEVGLSDSEAHHIIALAFQNGACSAKQVADLITQWHNPNFNEFKERNLWSLHNAFTEVFKQNSPTVVAQRSNALHVTLDKVALDTLTPNWI